MRKFEVTSLAAAGTTVTLVEANRLHHSEHAVSFTNGEGQNVSVFPLHRVISVTELVVADDVDPHARPELPTLSRKHPVYAYGKGDLREALLRAANMGGAERSYLRDIIADLKKGA